MRFVHGSPPCPLRSKCLGPVVPSPYLESDLLIHTVLRGSRCTPCNIGVVPIAILTATLLIPCDWPAAALSLTSDSRWALSLSTARTALPVGHCWCVITALSHRGGSTSGDFHIGLVSSSPVKTCLTKLTNDRQGLSHVNSSDYLCIFPFFFLPPPPDLPVSPLGAGCYFDQKGHGLGSHRREPTRWRASPAPSQKSVDPCYAYAMPACLFISCTTSTKPLLVGRQLRLMRQH